MKSNVKYIKKISKQFRKNYKVLVKRLTKIERKRKLKIAVYKYQKCPN